MMASPTKRRRRGRDVENLRPNGPTTRSKAAAAGIAAIVDLTGDSDSDDDDLDRKPKAKEKKEKSSSNNAVDADSQEQADVIDLTSPTKTDSEDNEDDDDDSVVVVPPPLAAMPTATSHGKYPSDEEEEEDAATLAAVRKLEKQNILLHEQQNSDLREAARLQKEYDEEQKRFLAAKRQEEEEQMGASVTGRAWKFVEKVLALDASIKKSKYGSICSSFLSTKISAIAKDDMVFLAAAMIRKQDTFRSAGKPVKVDLGFHYTRRNNLSFIRTDGLLSKAERDGRKIVTNFNGAAYGDGIYTSDDHSEGFAGGYGDVEIIVARLKGRGGYSHKFSGDHDSNVCNLRSVTVLKESSQCLALIEFQRSILSPPTAGAVAATTVAAAAPPHATRGSTAVAGPAALVPAAPPGAIHVLTSATYAPTRVYVPADAILQAAALESHPLKPTNAPRDAIFLNNPTQLYVPFLQGAGCAPLPRGNIRIVRFARGAAPPATPMRVPAVESGILAEYLRALQKIVDETFNQERNSSSTNPDH